MNPQVSRRDFAYQMGLIGSLATAGATLSQSSHAQDPHSALPNGWTGNETIAMLLYPGFTALDLFAPYHALSLTGARVQLVGKTSNSIRADTGVEVMPNMTFDQIADAQTILFVPGGTTGTIDAMNDTQTIEFVQRIGKQARWVTSVCTGSFVLAKAGLLSSYEATTHWLVLEHLKAFGTTPKKERVVVDRNRVTGAGVTSGFDMALMLISLFRNRGLAEAIQLLSEYDPQPPFDAGSPEKAPISTRKILEQMNGPFVRLLKESATHGP